MTLSEYSRPTRGAFNGQGNTPVKVSFITLNDQSGTGDRICFNIGKELYFYVYKGVRKVSQSFSTIKCTHSKSYFICTFHLTVIWSYLRQLKLSAYKTIPVSVTRRWRLSCHCQSVSHWACECQWLALASNLFWVRLVSQSTPTFASNNTVANYCSSLSSMHYACVFRWDAI